MKFSGLYYDNLLSMLRNFDSHTDNFLGTVFTNIFSTLCNVYRVYFDTDKKLKYKEAHYKFDDKYYPNKIDIRKLITNFKKYNNDNVLVVPYSVNEYFIIGELAKDKLFLINNDTLGNYEDMSQISVDIYVNHDCNMDELISFIGDKFEIYNNEKKVTFGIAAIDSSNTLYTSWYDYHEFSFSIKENYNDDLPADKIYKLIEEKDKPSLMLFYGEAGTGKTSFIKHLISKYNDMDFVFIDGSLLVNVQQDKLMSYFLENQNTVFILEDCEKVLMNREHYVNPVMSILLNITDGVIGDVLGIKIICTFNSDLSQIDKALLRKGRLSLKYEFKKLSKEKVYKILGEAVKSDMTLADIYNADENDFSKQQTKTIGFGC